MEYKEVELKGRKMGAGEGWGGRRGAGNGIRKEEEEKGEEKEQCKKMCEEEHK